MLSSIKGGINKFVSLNPFSNKDVLNAYEKREKIGNGASGIVYKCIRNSDNVEFAWKEMEIYELDDGTTNFKFLEYEYKVVQLLNKSANVLQFEVGAVVKDNKNNATTVVMISDLILGIDLERLIYSDVPISDIGKHWIIAQLLYGLQSMKRKNVIHFDIKPSNVMITENYDVTIIDFGSSLIADNNDEKKILSTTTYTNLDTVNGTVNMNTNLSNCDLWAVGCLMYELYHKNWLFKSLDAESHEKLLDDFPNDSKYFEDDDTNDFFLYIMHKSADVGTVPTIDDVIEHPWIKQYVDANKPQVI